MIKPRPALFKCPHFEPEIIVCAVRWHKREFPVLCSIHLTAQEPLNNETILKIVNAGIGEETIVGIVNQRPEKYWLADTDIFVLKSAGVSEKIIAAMIVRSGH